MYSWRARIGMLLPSTNNAAEPQIQRMLPDGVAFHTTRLKLTGSSEADIMGMTERLEDGAKLLADASVDLIVFHCTAASTFRPGLRRRDHRPNRGCDRDRGDRHLQGGPRGVRYA